MLGDLGVGLADAGRLEDHEIESGLLKDEQRLRHATGERDVGRAGRERAHVDPLVVDRVHPDPVTEKRATGLTT